MNNCIFLLYMLAYLKEYVKKQGISLITINTAITVIYVKKSGNTGILARISLFSTLASPLNFLKSSINGKIQLCNPELSLYITLYFLHF